MRNRENVNTFIQGLPFKLDRLYSERKLDHNPTLEGPVISFAILKNHMNRKHIPNEMTPKPSIEVNCIELTYRYQHHSRPQARHQYDRDNKASPAV